MFAAPNAWLTAKAGLSKVTYKGSGWSDADTVTIPSHAAGDLIVIYASRYTFSDVWADAPSAGGTVPTWTAIHQAGGGVLWHVKAAYAVATSSSHTSGTWTNATKLAVAVFSGAKGVSPIGGNATNTSSNTAPSITLNNTSGTSAIVHYLQASGSGSFSAAPTGYTSRIADTSSYLIRLMEKDVTTSDGSVDMGISIAQATASTIEILAP